MSNVIVYTSPTCGFCHMAKEYLKSKGIGFTEKDVTTDKTAYQEILDKSGQLGVPVLDIGGKIVVGFDKFRIDSLLNDND
ncbi:NrdH-redoxin [Candidatus Saccharibacteria bacterium CPR2]|nr:NrdH-redoxin [Candidatus Saccharibacteria bacterium CPR2]